MKVYLASRSPRRRDLLRQIGVDFELLDVDIDERWAPAESAEAHVPRLAVEKAETALHGHLAAGKVLSWPVLAADTAVVLEGEVLGKALDTDGARAMLTRLSGRWHEVYSAVALALRPGAPTRWALSRTWVSMAQLDPAMLEAYLATGESLGKAGGYAIQGRAAAFIRRIEGSYSGVMGLPLHETAALLSACGPP